MRCEEVYNNLYGKAPEAISFCGYRIAPLGAHIDHWFKDAVGNRSIIGKKAGALSVSKDGGDVDAITAATISSRAFLKAINKAYAAIATEPVEAASGASQLQSNEKEAEL